MKKRSGKRIKIKGKVFNSIKSACKHFNINYSTVVCRMHTKYLNLEQAMFGDDYKVYSGVDYYLYSFKVRVLV